MSRKEHGRLRLASIAILAVLALSVACDPSSRNENTDELPMAPVDIGEPLEPVEPPEPIASLTNERFLGHVESELDRVNPRDDGWDSEAFSEAAASRLTQLGELITTRSLQPAALAPLLAADFVCGPLRPRSLKDVFHHGDLAVRRGDIDSETGEGTQPGGPRPRKGAAGLIDALQPLLDALEPSAALRVKFKVVHVDTGPDAPDGPDGATSRVLFALVAQDAKRALERSAVWTCRWKRGDEATPPVLLGIDVVDYEEVELAAAHTLFTDCTESLFVNSDGYRRQLRYGLDHWSDLLDWRFGWELIGPHGLALDDVNGDGLDDLYVCETGGLPNRLLLQQPDGTVRDVSADSGVDYVEPTQSALLVDLDNDADQDLVIACGTYLLVFDNDGSGHFARRYLTSSTSLIRSMAAVDYDLDGFLDIFVCGYSSRQTTLDGVGLGRPLPYHDANNGSPNYLLRNQGSWKFEDVTAAVGLDANNRRFSYAAAWEDYDLDGDADLYVANDFGRNNLYRNDGGRFVDVAAAAGVEDIAAGMSVSWGDYNRDGRPDLYVGNMFSSAGGRIAYQRRFKEDETSTIREHYQRHARGNSLFENAGDGTFHDVSVVANVNVGRWAWSSNFVDINSDGWEDIVVANGMVTGADDTGDL